MRFDSVLSVLLAATYFLAGTGSAQDFLGKDAPAWERELNDAKDPRARRNAAFALGKLGGQASLCVGSLKKHLLEDSSAEVREAAAYALGEIGRESLNVFDDPTLVTALGTALSKDAEPLVRRSAAVALGHFGSSAQPVLATVQQAINDSSPIVRQNVAWALGRISPKTVPNLRRALQDSDLLVRRDAAGSLAQLKPAEARPAVDELVGCLSVGNSEVRLAALNVLIKILGPEDAKAAPRLREALKDSDLEVRQNAALALANIGGAGAAPAVPILIDAIQHGESNLRRQAAAAIRNIGPDAAAAIPMLKKGLADPDREFRQYAAMALGGIGPRAYTAVPDLVNMVANPNEDKDVRAAAATALSRMNPAEADGNDREPMMRLLEGSVPRLLEVLEDTKNPIRVRERVIWALRVHNVRLAELKGVIPTFTKVIYERLTPETRLIHYDCAYLLGVLQGPEVRDKVLDLLTDFLKDKDFVLFKSTEVKAGGAGVETPGGRTNVADVGQGDFRIMAIQALERIGRDRIMGRTDLIRELRAIVADPQTVPELKERTQKLLKTLDG
jgi:HEAT repeat protein